MKNEGQSILERLNNIEPDVISNLTESENNPVSTDPCTLSQSWTLNVWSACAV